MANAQFGLEDCIASPAIWIEDPSDPASQPLFGTSDPSHVYALVEFSFFDEPSSLPSTVPEGDPDGTPVDGSVESGRAERGIRDDIWRLPDG